LSALFQEGAFCPLVRVEEGRDGIAKDLEASDAEDFLGD
jgi:hypothetical protein